MSEKQDKYQYDFNFTEGKETLSESIGKDPNYVENVNIKLNSLLIELLEKIKERNPVEKSAKMVVEENYKTADDIILNFLKRTAELGVQEDSLGNYLKQSFLAKKVTELLTPEELTLIVVAEIKNKMSMAAVSLANQQIIELLSTADLSIEEKKKLSIIMGILMHFKMSGEAGELLSSTIFLRLLSFFFDGTEIKG